MSKIEHMPSTALSEASSSPGINRYMAFKAQDHLILRARSEGGAVSGWHHHGDYHVYGFAVAGSGLFESEDGDSITVRTGDFFHVPPHTPHREINPSADEPNEFILFLVGSGPLVFNLDSPGPQ